jgi:hypothetical protein
MNRVLRDYQDKIGAAQEREIRRLSRNIEIAYRQAYRDIRGRMTDMWERAGGEMTPGFAREYNRLGSMLDSIEKNYSSVLRDVDRASRVAMPRQYQEELLRRFWQIDEAVGLSLSWGSIPRRAVELAVNNPLSKLKESALLATDRRRRLYRVRQALTQSVLQGRTFFQASRQVAKALDAGMNESVRVVRTESNRIWGQAQVDAMKRANEIGVETKLQLISTFDQRTRGQSARMDKQVSDEEGRFRYPDGGWYVKGQTGHPEWDINDRETTIPSIEDLAPATRRARDQAESRGDLVQNETFEQWARRRDYTVNRYGETLFGNVGPGAAMPKTAPTVAGGRG